MKEWELREFVEWLWETCDTKGHSPYHEDLIGFHFFRVDCRDCWAEIRREVGLE